MRRALAAAGLVLALAACTPPRGGWGDFSNSDPYDMPQYRRGVSPW